MEQKENENNKSKGDINPFFSINTLMTGGQEMLQLIKDVAEETYTSEEPVHPQIKPGFLRHQLAETPPSQGKSINSVINMTKSVLFPGVMKWQSPKFFGYFPSSINVTNIFGDMFAVITQSPNFNYAISPAWTQLENIMVDWAALALGLPEQFLLKNSGGGIINNSASESIFNSVHMAKYLKRKELNLQLDNPEVLKFVGYFGKGSHLSSQRGLLIKDIHHRRAVPYVYNEKIKNYELDVGKLEEMLEEDVKKGLIPFWFGFNYGTTSCGAIDISQRACQLCKKYKMWINVDAAFLGSTWISPKYRPSQAILNYVDSIVINFSKLLLNGTGGSLFYIRDKKIITESFGNASLNFHFYKNQYTGQNDVVDYKDWIVGLARRNNALKLYYTFEHYGMKVLVDAVEGQQQKLDYLLDLIAQEKGLFKLHTKQYGVMTFYVLDKDGKTSDAITREVNKRVINAKEGFSSPGQFEGNAAVRIVIGHFFTTNEHVKKYFDKIVEVARELQNTQ